MQDILNSNPIVMTGNLDRVEVPQHKSVTPVVRSRTWALRIRQDLLYLLS